MSAPISSKTRMSDLINYRLRILTVDNRYFVGSLLAFDKHFNLVLADTEESRTTKKSLSELKKNGGGKAVYDKRVLGLVILRGEQIVSLSIESAPTVDLKKRLGLDKVRAVKAPVSVKSRLQGPSIRK